MFDPSKLNLDLENKQKKAKKTKSNTDNNIQEIKKIEEKNDDILENIEISNAKNTKNVVKYVKKDKKDINKIDEKDEKIQIKKDTKIQNKQKNEKENEIPKIIYDININSLQEIFNLLIDNEYDFVIFEPDEQKVKITFKKNKIDKDVRYIKYPTYSQIIIKAKKITNLEIEETGEIQEWNWDISLKNKSYKAISKVVPDSYWEKLFLKLKETQKKVIKKTKKTSLSQIFGFLWAIAFIALVIGGAFIGFVVMNAKTVEDVKFFYSLGINLNDINTFITKIITVIFSILVFIETIFLIIYLFKFSLTKKQFRPKKIRYWIIATIFLIITFSTASFWMVIDKKIRSLPNWQEMAYWDVQIYDNSKLISEQFDKWWALITDTSNIIWPIEIKFDLSFFAQKEEQQWFKINKFIWDFWIEKEKIIETPNPIIIKKFTQKWNYEISLIVEEKDLKWDIIEKKVENIPSINLSYIVEKNEKKLNNWWKLIDFDATSLKELWKIEWYFFEDLSTPVWTGDTFKVWKPIFEETLVWMYIRRNDKETEELDKVFVISKETETNLDWEILYIRSLENDLEIELKVNNTQVDYIWAWFIEEFKWIIWDKEITKVWDFNNPQESSKITYEFKNYGQHTVKLILKNSSWDTKEISTIVDIPKQLKMKNLLKIYNMGNEIEDITYEPKLNEYFLWEIWIPTKLTLDARRVKWDNLLYILREVNWDFDSNWDIDKSAKTTTYDVNSNKTHNISVEYVFEHIKIKWDIIKVNEILFFEAVKKEAILDFEIINNTTYTPVTVKFDASKSIVKDDDIVKFIWDYGDWIIEERDSIVPGHKYLTPDNYTIKLKIITKKWKEFETSKQLILKPKPQNIKIGTSMKKTIVNQGIDFYSSDSEGQIIWYLWDFGDWNKSTQPNPSHSYSRPWIYTVNLKVDFSNNNVMEDKIKIEIIKEY